MDGRPAVDFCTVALQKCPKESNGHQSKNLRVTHQSQGRQGFKPSHLGRCFALLSEPAFMFFVASGSDYTRPLRLGLEVVAGRPVQLETSLMALKKRKKQETLMVGGWRLQVAGARLKFDTEDGGWRARHGAKIELIEHPCPVNSKIFFPSRLQEPHLPPPPTASTSRSCSAQWQTTKRHTRLPLSQNIRSSQFTPAAALPSITAGAFLRPLLGKMPC